jgi:hypothetical protein
MKSTPILKLMINRAIHLCDRPVAAPLAGVAENLGIHATIPAAAPGGGCSSR